MLKSLIKTTKINLFGMHQRDDIHIFSPIPLYEVRILDEIQSDDTAFLILGGSSNHQDYLNKAKDYQLKNVKFLDTASATLQ